MKKLGWLVSALIVVSAPGAAATSSGSVPSFRAREFDTTVKAAFSVAVGDLDGDGKADVVASHGTDFPVELRSVRAVSVFLNRGDGRLKPPKVYPTGKQGDIWGAMAVAIGDLTADGKADIVSANPGGHSVSVLVNSGRGQFLPAVNYAIGREPWDIAIAELDGDGKPDIVTANQNTVSVLLNSGDGTFENRMEFPGGRDTWGSVVGDFNRDGKADLATANQNHGSGTVSVHINQGGGSFQTRTQYPTAPGPRAIAMGDLNRDGAPDLVTVNGSHDPYTEEWIGTVSVLINKGDGTFLVRRGSRKYHFFFNGVRVGDMNGDGKADLAIAEGDSDFLLEVALNRGNGRFPKFFEYGRDPDDDGGTAVALGDLNGDRRLDAVIPKWRAVSVFINAPGLCNVPKVTEVQLAVAKRRLAERRCRVGAIRWEKGTPRGLVDWQRPEAGAVLPNGGKVNLTVQNGKSWR
jgi:hypothetical protein